MGSFSKRGSLFVALVGLVASLLAISTHALALAPDGYEPDFPNNMPTLLVDQQSAQERTLTMGDVDFVRVHVEAGKSYVFTVLSKPAYSAGAVSMTLWPDGFGSNQSVTSLQQVSTIPGSGMTEIRFNSSETGAVVLQIESDPPLSSECAYWLAAYTDGQPWWEDPYEIQEVNPGAPGTFASVDAPAITRSLDGMGDVDTFDVFIQPGQYVISTGFSSLGIAPDTSIDVWDFAGTTRLSNDDGPDGGPLSELRITATQPDVWRIQVSSLKGKQFGAYTLSASSAPLSSGSVRGSVIGPSGETIPLAPVELISPETWVPFMATTTDGSGSFSFSAVPFGVPFLIRARQDGSGLVPAFSPEVRDLDRPVGVYCLLSAENPEYDRQLRLKLPWVEGKVRTATLANVDGLDVTAHDLAGNVIATGKTYGDGFHVSLPAGTEQCRLEFSDSAGVYRTTWFDGKSTEASADTVYLPTFRPLEMTVRQVSDPDFIDNYRAALAGIVVVFDRVAVPYGMVVGNQASQHPAPPGFRFVNGGTYQIHPQMQFWGNASVTLSIPADEAANATNIRMFHWVNGAWQDVTSNVDIGNLKVVGLTDSFSEYALMAPTAQQPVVVSTPASSWWSTSLFALLLAFGLSIVGSRLRRA